MSELTRTKLSVSCPFEHKYTDREVCVDFNVLLQLSMETQQAAIKKKKKEKKRNILI